MTSKLITELYENGMSVSEIYYATGENGICATLNNKFCNDAAIGNYWHFTAWKYSLSEIAAINSSTIGGVRWARHLHMVEKYYRTGISISDLAKEVHLTEDETREIVDSKYNMTEIKDPVRKAMVDKIAHLMAKIITVSRG